MENCWRLPLEQWARRRLPQIVSYRIRSPTAMRGLLDPGEMVGMVLEKRGVPYDAGLNR